MSEPPPDKKDPGTGSTDRTDNSPSVRSVAVGAASLTVAALAIVGFAVAGPLGLLAAGAVTVTGGVAASRARRNARQGTSRAGGRPGLLATLAGRPRRPRAVRGLGSLPWPLTGSQSKRGSKGRAAGGSGATGGSRRRRAGAALRGLASGGPKLPALTKKGREKRRTAHLATGSHGRAATKTPGSRAAVRPGAKPTGARAPRTPSRTPARAGSARKLTAAPGRAKTPGGATPGARLRGATRRSPGSGGVGTLRTSTRRGNGAQSRRQGRAGLPKLGGGTGTAGTRKRTGVRPSTTARPVRRHTRPGGATPRLKTGTGTRRSTGRVGLRTPKTPTRPGSRPSSRPTLIRRNRPAPSSRTRNRATGGNRRATTNAKRLGDLSTPIRRRDHRAAAKATPKRTIRRPRPAPKKQPTRRLVSTAMRLPRRNGWKISRPTKAQQRRARKVLSRHAGRAAKRGALWSVKAPFKASAVTARWSWLHRPLWLYPKAPVAVDPSWLVPTVPEPRLSTSPGQKRYEEKTGQTKTRRHRTPYPTVNARRSPGGGTPAGAPRQAQPVTQPTGGTITMSAPAQSVAEAFSAIANFTPQTPEDLEVFLQQNAEMIQQFGAAFQTLGQRMTSEMPLAQPVAAATAELGAALAACEGIAGQIHSTYMSAHQVEKDRRENPRPNEGFWDVNNR